MLTAASAPASGWTRHESVSLPGGARADALAIPVGDVLGWLVAAGADQVGDDIGPSVRWLGRVAIWAVELTAHGAMVPLLRQRKRSSGSAQRVERLVLGALDARARSIPSRLARLADEHAGQSCCALDPSVDARALTRSALTGMVDAICRDSARRLEVPAPPPRVRTATDVAEAFLARLDGSAFDAPVRIARRDRDARRAVGRARSPASTSGLIVRLDPPDDGNAWHLAVFASGPEGRARPDRARDRRRRLRARATSKTRSRASSACCPRCCARAARGAAR